MTAASAPRVCVACGALAVIEKLGRCSPCFRLHRAATRLSRAVAHESQARNVTPRHHAPGMGHRFDESLRCSQCGATYHRHAATLEPCPTG